MFVAYFYDGIVAVFGGREGGVAVQEIVLACVGSRNCVVN